MCLVRFDGFGGFDSTYFAYFGQCLSKYPNQQG